MAPGQFKPPRNAEEPAADDRRLPILDRTLSTPLYTQRYFRNVTFAPSITNGKLPSSWYTAPFPS
jgi:hypothetical protein